MTNLSNFKPTDFTSMARPLDPFTYMTNRLIMAFTVVGGVIAGGWTLATQSSLLAAISAGFFTGAALFIAWVFSRDVDPDNDMAAFVSSAFAFLFCLGRADILPLAAVVFALRMVSRVVGPAPKVTDSALALLVTALAVFSGYWTVGIVMGIAFILDGVLSRPLRLQLAFAGLAFVGTLGWLVVVGARDGGVLSYLTLLFLLVATGLGAFASWHMREVKVLADVPTYTLDVVRLRACLVLTFAFGVGGVLQYGDAGALGLSATWATLAGVGAYRLFLWVRARR
jgi:hypothetical protein